MSYTITLPYDPVETVEDWAIKNCPSYITNVLDYVGPKGELAEMSLTYYFGEEKDAVLFALRWA